MAKKAKRGTASAAYAEARANVKAELARIQHRLAEHAERQAARPDDWGFSGDLEHLAATLRELLPDAQAANRFIWRDGDIEILKTGGDE